MNVKNLDNQAIQNVLKTIAKDLREATSDGIALLVEIGLRELHVSEGYASLFTYCLGELCFTKGMASRWSRAAKSVASCPDVVERLRDGRLSLCVVTVLADCPELLARADYMTKEQAERLLVTVRPRAERRDVVPAVVLPAEPGLAFADSGPALCVGDRANAGHAAQGAVGGVVEGTSMSPGRAELDCAASACRGAAQEGATHAVAALRGGDQVWPFHAASAFGSVDPVGPTHTASPSVAPTVGGHSGTVSASATAAGPRRPAIEPVTATKSRLHFDVDAETLAKLQRAREIMRGKDVGAIFGAALEMLLHAHDPLRRHERREMAKAERANGPRAERKPRRRPHLERAVKDAAQASAGGRCEFVGKSGKRCTEREWSEHDHIQPLALGGANDQGNLRILCRRHHRYVTERTFPEWGAVATAR